MKYQINPESHKSILKYVIVYLDVRRVSICYLLFLEFLGSAKIILIFQTKIENLKFYWMDYNRENNLILVLLSKSQLI
jgi:hypothetical protein